MSRPIRKVKTPSLVFNLFEGISATLVPDAVSTLWAKLEIA